MEDYTCIPFVFNEKVIVRTPLLPYSNKIDHQFICQQKENPLVNEAIYLASPSFYYELQKDKHDKSILSLKEKEKINTTLYKYISRMSSRSTPFGLFAGCSIGKWAKQKNFVLEDTIKRNTRLDMQYFYNLANDLCQLPEIRHNIKFYKNSSLYKVGHEYRFVNYQYIYGRRSHHITAISYNKYLEKILKATATGIYYNELIALVDDPEISYLEKKAFIDDLIDCQILISSLESPVTCEAPIKHLLNILYEIKKDIVKPYITLLEQSNCLLDKIDDYEGNNLMLNYHNVIEMHKEIKTSIQENRFFQVNMFRTTKKNYLNIKTQPLILQALQALNYLTPPFQNSLLNDFKVKFSQQYEDQEIPLAEVMDTDIGIGYGKKKRNLSSLVKGLCISPKRNSSRKLEIELCEKEKMLSRLLMEAHKEEKYEVDFISHLDLSTLPWHDVPDVLSCFFRMISFSRIAIDVFTGNSAARIISRFASYNEDIKELCYTIADYEQISEAGKIIAEIVHLPNSRDANIVMHPAFRIYEIPYLGQASVSHNHQITMDDLLVSVRNDQIVLRSKKHNKEVIPRLTNTHNFISNSQPVYRFLCDLQYQNIRANFKFHWGSTAPLYKFSPRACYGKDIVLAPAQWTFTQEDTACITAGDTDSTIRQFRERWKLPPLVTIAEGDNELFIDFENPLSVKVLIEVIKKSSNIIIREFLFDPSNAAVKDTQDRTYNNECVATLLKQPIQKKKNIKRYSTSVNNVPREFPVGTEWLYFKIYCGEETANTLLTQSISPLIQKFHKERLIKKWFFIRYTDPDPHLRVRFLMNDIREIGYVIQGMNESLQYYQNHRFIKNLQLETYKRELERYGNQAIELSESIFYADSEAILGMLCHIEQYDEPDTTRWLWSLKSIDTLLEAANFKTIDKLAVVSPLKESFSYEFNLDKAMKRQINSKYRKYECAIRTYLTEDQGLNHQLNELLIAKHLKIKDSLDTLYSSEKSSTLEVPIYDILRSHIHMHVNRVFSTEQRLHELIIYDMLCKHYTTQIHLEKSAQASVLYQ